ncbi:biotin--[acetyl-CoA-carboxylase] ligase [Leptolyngbya sp. Cla-17]|uniref:biotin--[acetyl-CoA-carboxylase] ligase n=1 Tax=Leptolyngbya sp. Cla-17 TaxID=2803751 RepID=UPI0018D7CFD7|nr:biotin--[acetyl-CoA-carboxylase] ligase [Leptolyngbya sp. Cla-17]
MKHREALIPFPASGNPDPMDLPGWLHWVDSCPSTNTWATTHADRLPHGAVVFTRRQTAGRGQHGRTWHSPMGVLTASFILDFPMPQLSGLSLVIGLAVIHAIEDLLPDQRGRLCLKWSNDVLIAGRKVAGILCEATSGSRSGQTRVVVGIGLNRCVDFVQAELSPDQVGNAISLHEISTVPEELDLLERSRHYLMQVRDIVVQHWDSSRFDGIVPLFPELHQRDGLRDRSITLELNGESISGQAVGFDDQGRLLVRSPQGVIHPFTSGRIIQY